MKSDEDQPISSSTIVAILHGDLNPEPTTLNYCRHIFAASPGWCYSRRVMFIAEGTRSTVAGRQNYYHGLSKWLLARSASILQATPLRRSLPESYVVHRPSYG